MPDFHDAIREAVRIVGGQARLANKIGCAQSEISRLCTSAVSISPKTAMAVKEATGGRIKLADMLPDFVCAVVDELSVLSPETVRDFCHPAPEATEAA